MSRPVLALVLVLLAFPAWAGRTCEARRLNAADFYQGAEAAYRLYQVLEWKNPAVAIVGRAGADISKHGLKYTHAGIVVRDHPKGRWLFVHALNRCGTARSALYDEGLMNFFLDEPFRLDALIMIPSPRLQQRIEAAILSGLGKALHQPRYSMLANPRRNRYQNSNGWILDLIATAQLGLQQADSKRPRRFLIGRGFQGDMIRLSPLEHLGAGLFKANVHFDDHPPQAVAEGRYEVVTVRALMRYLQKTDAVWVGEVRAPEKKAR